MQNIVDVNFYHNNIFDFPIECCIQIYPIVIKTISYLIWIKNVPTIFWPFFSTHPKLLIKSVSRQKIWTGQLSHSLIPNERVLY